MSEGLEPKYISKSLSENVYLFGTDKEPFILEFNMSNGFVISKPVPLKMRLFSYMGGMSIGDNKFILFGGVRDFMDKI